MLHLLIDTCTWIDLAERRDGQRWIVALRMLVHERRINLLVPPLVLDEFDRNKPSIEAKMTASIATRFKLIRQDLLTYGGKDEAHAVEVIEDLAQYLPLVGAMTTRNFTEIRELLSNGQALSPTDTETRRVVERGLSKSAPLHLHKNSVADALLIELYGTTVAAADLMADPHVFVTGNSADFSQVHGDNRKPHSDLSAFFDGVGSRYALGVNGLDRALRDNFGDELEELFAETDFREEPRRLDEIGPAEQALFDRIWYHRSRQHDYQLEAENLTVELGNHRSIAAAGRKRVEETYTTPGELGPYSDFELGMLHGKLSALRWVLGSEWDFLDT
jgi:tryptophan 2,3-dioxygenase